MKVKSESEVAQSCLTLSDPMDYSLPGSSVHGSFQARVLEWGAIAFSSAHSEYLINVSQPPKLVSWAGPLLYFRCLVLRVQGELAWLTEDNCESETWKVTSSKERREGGRETEKGKEKKKGPARSLQER